MGFNSSTLCLIPLSGVNLKVQIQTSGPSRINVLPPRKGTVHLHSNVCWLCTVKQHMCTHIYSNESAALFCFFSDTFQVERSVKAEPVKLATSGYYYQESWRPLGGLTVQQFNESSAVIQCLKNKVINMFGDSTVRQWFEHLVAFAPGQCPLCQL